MRQRGLSHLAIGAIALVVVTIGCYLGFTKRIPFRSHYEVRAVLADANLLTPRSPVRIAGVEVGRVASVRRYKHTALSVVTMRITAAGRPIHRDATLKVRPRLFLEGNFYVDMTPGTPQAPELADDGMVPLSQTASPVQLDNVLTALDSGARVSLQRVVRGFGAALGDTPSAAQDAASDPAVRGRSGGEALHETLRTSPRALRDTAVVTEALRGPRAGDLSRTISGFARAAKALDADEAALAGLVTSFDATLQTTAQHGDDLTRTVARLAPTLRGTRRALADVRAGLPGTRRTAQGLTRAMAELPATITAARPWLAQATPLLGDAELGGLLDSLEPVARSTARTVAGSSRFLPRIDDFDRCLTDVLIPTGDVKVQDGPLSAGVENYKELWYAMVGQASESQVFDGNGSLLRLQAIGGSNRLESGITNYVAPTDGPLFANTTLRPTRTSPAFPNRLPPLRTDVACHTQPVPDVNGPSATGPADGSAAGAKQPEAPPIAGGGG